MNSDIIIKYLINAFAIKFLINSQLLWLIWFLLKYIPNLENLLLN